MNSTPVIEKELWKKKKNEEQNEYKNRKKFKSDSQPSFKESSGRKYRKFSYLESKK